jgi:hypothetical protein
MDMSRNATSEHFLTQVDRLVDWAPLTPLIDAISARMQADVPPATVKMLLLARWYGLSEAALLEACQDRISFRRFLGLPLSDSPDDARLAEAFRRYATQAPTEVRNLVEAIEAQLRARGFSIKPGMWAEATVVAASSQTGISPFSETALFQPADVEDLIKQGEAALVRGGAAMMVSTTPPYSNTGAVMLTPPPGRVSTVRAFIEWPWGATTALAGRLNIGRLGGFSPVAAGLDAYLHVSRKHAELMVCPEGVWVRDLRSRNGTFVNDERLPDGQGFLVDSDARIRFGPYCIVQLKIKHD